jgi:DNA-binding PadR family transcriptional regulator
MKHKKHMDMARPEGSMKRHCGEDEGKMPGRGAGKMGGHEGGKMSGRHGGGGVRGRRGGGKRLFDYGELRLLMLAMIVAKPRHGYELIKDISERFEGRYSPSPGVVYPTLSWLEDMGYISLTVEEGGRKLSRITPEGEAFLAANRQAADELLTRKPPKSARGDAPEAIAEAMNRLKSALHQRLNGVTASEEEISEMARQIDMAAEAIAKL